MKAILGPNWELSTDHAASSAGQPVLVNRGTDKAYGPRDILEPYPSWGRMPAARAVARIAETKALDTDGEALVARFVGSVPPR